MGDSNRFESIRGSNRIESIRWTESNQLNFDSTRENRMKIGREMAEIRTPNGLEIGRLSTFLTSDMTT